MTSRFVGVDVGINGAVAWQDWDDDHCTNFGVFDVPTIKVGKRNEINVTALFEVLDTIFWSVRLVAVEKVSAMPKQGVASTFRFGDSFGVVRAAVASYRVPMIYPRPQEWKKAMLRGVGAKNDKDASRLRAIERLPMAAPDLSRKKDHNRGEALLIAEFARMCARMDKAPKNVRKKLSDA